MNTGADLQWPTKSFVVLCSRCCFSSVFCKSVNKFWTIFGNRFWWILPLPRLLTSLLKKFSPQIRCQNFFRNLKNSFICKTLKVTINHRNLGSWNFWPGKRKIFKFIKKILETLAKLLFCDKYFQERDRWFVFFSHVTSFLCLPPVDNVILLHLSLSVEFYPTFSVSLREI